MMNLFLLKLALVILASAPMPLRAAEVQAPVRTIINLGDSPWKFLKDAPGPDVKFEKRDFNDSQWKSVGVPHCFNDMDTYLNDNKLHQWHGTVWYRKHFTLGPELSGRRLMLEFQGATIGAAVYVNGVFKPGNTAVPQPQEVTHVGGFLPFAVDITDDVRPGDNVIAVRVSNSGNSFFTWPEIGTVDAYGMSWGGLVCPVLLYATHDVYIPLNSYSPTNQWGTYIATTGIENSRASVRVQTRVANAGAQAAPVQLNTSYIDAGGKAVLSLDEARTIPAKSSVQFDQAGVIGSPTLWYPNNSPYGKPYLYRVVSKVRVGGKIVDQTESRTGLRIITWDDDYCYVNGKKHLLLGFGHRNTYPALGTAIPAEVQWKDIKLIAEAGGNALRIGHLPAPRAMVEACDAYGVLVIMNSGDNEWSLSGSLASVYKREYDRDMIIAFRNHPSIAIWEANNGLDNIKDRSAIYWPSNTKQVVDQWDALQPRIVLTRDSYPAEQWNPKDRIVVGYTNRYQKVKGSPSLNVEVYGANWDKKPCQSAARFDYDYEKQFVNWYTRDLLSNLDDKACGWIDWMLAETQGEGYLIYLNGKDNQKSLGSCAMDGNRFPKLLYNVFKNALWVPFETRPGVALQSHRNLSGQQDVDAWSNCPRVELFVNGKSKGVQSPDPRSKRCTWKNITWEKGVLKAVGLDPFGMSVCADQRITAGAPDHIVLKVEPPLVKPDGSKFAILANGVDAAIVTAMIVDRAGNWCPLADNDIRFSVAGPGVYEGSYNFYVVRDRDIHYHAPGDRELQAEGGLMRIAVRTTFKPGTVTVKAESRGLAPGTASFQSAPTAPDTAFSVPRPG